MSGLNPSSRSCRSFGKPPLQPKHALNDSSFCQATSPRVRRRQFRLGPPTDICLAPAFARQESRPSPPGTLMLVCRCLQGKALHDAHQRCVEAFRVHRLRAHTAGATLVPGSERVGAADGGRVFEEVGSAACAPCASAPGAGRCEWTCPGAPTTQTSKNTHTHTHTHTYTHTHTQRKQEQ